MSSQSLPGPGFRSVAWRWGWVTSPLVLTSLCLSPSNSPPKNNNLNTTNITPTIPTYHCHHEDLLHRCTYLLPLLTRSSPPSENPWPVGLARQNRKLTPKLQVIRNTPKPAHELCAVKDLTSFSYFQRSTVGEFLTMFSGTVAERTGPASRQDIEEQCNLLLPLPLPLPI